MGLFGGSSSSSQETNTRIENVGADQGSISGSYSTINVLDAGAVGQALDVGQQSIEAALATSTAQNAAAFDFAGGSLAALNSGLNNSLETAFEFASESLGIVRDSLGFVDETSERALASADRALGEALDVTDATQTGGSERLLIFGGLAVAALVFVAYFNR